MTYEEVRPNFCSSCGQLLPKESGDTTSSEQETIVRDEPPPKAPEGSDNQSIDPTPDSLIDGYRLIRQLGQGGMGVVWEAEHETSGRHVALKLLSSSLASNTEHVDRFLREARLAASLSHPRSTFVFGAGQHGSNPYIVMELMPGETLQNAVEESGKLSVEQAVDSILDAIDGLKAAHELGVIHRDVKPSNCFIDGDGRVKIGDFGLSKSLVSDARLTQTGTFLGTPLYAAPEQVRGGAVDARTDVYSVGATLFFLLTGEGPFEGDAVSVIAQIASDPPRRLRDVLPDAPLPLDKIIAKALEKQPEKRYQSLEELRAALVPFASGGTAIVDLGRRLAAYLIDYIIFGILTNIIMSIVHTSIAISTMVSEGSEEFSDRFAKTLTSYAVVIELTEVLILCTLFALTEWWFGRAVGKWLMGLKIVDLQGTKPKLWQTTVRTIFIPGAFGLSLLPIVLGIPMNLQIDSQLGPDDFSILEIIRLIFLGLVANFFMFSCFVSVRKSNGFRGVHDLLTGTRVVRFGAGLFRVKQLVLPKPETESTPLLDTALGPYTITGKLRDCPSATILTARDNLLAREVWIRTFDEEPYSGSESNHSPRPIRPARPHWLQSGHDESSATYWEAFEAIEGAPIGRAIQLSGNERWHRAALWNHELAIELCAACNDHSLPATLQLDQVWVDQEGQVKVLDEPVGAHAMLNAKSTDTSYLIDDDSPHRRAYELLRRTIAEGTRDQLMSPDTQEFISEFEKKDPSQSTLEWARDRLATIASKPRVINIESRLATLAIAIGFEALVYVFVPMLLVFTAVGMGVPPAVAGLGLLVFMLGFIGVLAGWLRGGVIFQQIGVDILDRKGRPASRLRCAIRAIVCWFAWVYLVIAVVTLIGFTIAGDDSVGSQGSPLVGVIVLLSTLAIPFCILAQMTGIVFALVFPRKSVQDLICGTILVPR